MGEVVAHTELRKIKELLKSEKKKIVLQTVFLIFYTADMWNT